MKKNIKDSTTRHIALTAFANSVKTTGKFEWIMTTILISVFGGFLVFFISKFYNFPTWIIYILLVFMFIVGLYVGHEIYLARIIRGYEIKSFLELTSLVGFIINKLERIELSLIKEIDLVIGIKKDVVKNEEEKIKVNKLNIEKIKQDIITTIDDNMIFKYCPIDKENVYVSKQMKLCPFCWNKLEEIKKDETKSSDTKIKDTEKINSIDDKNEEIIFD